MITYMSSRKTALYENFILPRTGNQCNILDENIKAIFFIRNKFIIHNEH